MSPKIVELGAFPLGARPSSIEYQFLQQDGTVEDLTTGTWTGQARSERIHTNTASPAGIGAGTVTIVVNTATATYNWVTADFATVGVFDLIIWIGNTTNRMGSAIFRYEVFDAPGIAPTV